MEVRFDNMIDVSSTPFVFSLRRVRKAMECLQMGDTLKVRAMSLWDGGEIHDLAYRTKCDVIYCKTDGCISECLIRKL